MCHREHGAVHHGDESGEASQDSQDPFPTDRPVVRIPGIIGTVPGDNFNMLAGVIVIWQATVNQ